MIIAKTQAYWGNDYSKGSAIPAIGYFLLNIKTSNYKNDKFEPEPTKPAS